jgi:hypothetical protein
MAEQFGALFDIGFDTGVSVAVEWNRQRLPNDEREANENLMKSVRLAIFASGLAKIKTEFCAGERVARLKIKLKIEMCQQEIYAESWAFDSAADHRFLDQIERGLPLELSDRAGEEYFEGELERLHATNRVIRTTPVYWYLLGIVKGALCWFLSDRGTEPLRSAGDIRPTIVLRLLPTRGSVVNAEAQLVFAQNLLCRALERDIPQQE